MACGLGVQIAGGYYRFELPLYLIDLMGLRMVGFFQLAALALFVQVLVNHKHLGHFVMVLYFVVHHPAHRRAGTSPLPIRRAPGYPYSDMNGYGHFLPAWGWFNLYWSLAAMALALLSIWLWPRGQDTGFRQRLRLALQRSRGGSRWVMALVGLGFAATGAFIFYNTNVLNEYQTSKDSKREQVDYERKYKQHQKQPQPRVTDVRVHFDIWPERNALRMTGRFQLTNKTAAPIPVCTSTWPRTRPSTAWRWAGWTGPRSRTMGWSSTPSSCRRRWPRSDHRAGVRSRAGAAWLQERRH